MGLPSGFLIPGLIFLLTLASGFWLSRAGKPLKTGIVTVHKLIALAAVILTVIRTYGALTTMDVQAILIALLAVIGLCAVTLFVTGALMSANKPGYGGLLTVHRVAPLVVVGAGVVAVYLLRGIP
jgi:hypothetical protein